MPRSVKRKKRDPYSTNLERLSVYPSYKNISKKEEKRGVTRLKEGATIRVRVTGVDDEGRPTGIYKGYEISIETQGVELEPGEAVNVKVKKIIGRKGYGEFQGKSK